MKKIVIIEWGLGAKELFGIQRNTREILRCLDDLVKKGQVEMLIPVREEDNYNFKNIKVTKTGVMLKHLGVIGYRLERYIYKNIYTKKYAKKENTVSVDMLLQFPLYGCDVISIYDCIPELFPEHYTTRQRKRQRGKILKHQKMAVEKAKVILTDSQDAKEDIMKFYGVQDGKIEVVPCGWQHFNRVEEDDKIIEKLKLENSEFFFSLGSRLPHKNIKWVSYAAKANPQYKFVISGSNRTNMNFDFEGEKLSNMIFAGYLSDGEVKALMRRCKAFIQPSLYEGFGIPPMEAMSVGANCIVSDRASLPEVYKNSVWYINPEDYEHVDLDKIMSKPKESNDIILEEYSWEKSAKKLLDILIKL